MATSVRPTSSSLSPLETLMWRLGRDPWLRSTFGSVSLLDAEPDLDRLRERLRGALVAVPRLRLRVVDPGGPVGTPQWEDDPDFDLDHHLRAVDAPGHGDLRAVLDHATELVATPLDASRPGWTFEVITGMDDGRAALVQRMHHTITDGEGGIRFSAQFLDVERDAAAPLVSPRPPTTHRDDTGPVGPTERLGDLARNAVDVGRWAAGGLVHPSRFTEAGAEVVDVARSLGRQLVVIDHGRSQAWRSRSDARHLEVLSVSFADLRAVADAAGASVNDVFVAAATRAAGAYHRDQGEALAELRLAMPVSTRRRGGGGGNAFSPTRVVLPTDEGDAAAHLAAVSSRLQRTKRESFTTVIEPLAGIVDVVPVPVLTRVARRQAATIDLTVSNVRAAPFPLHVAGARILATWALGPLAATPCNITMMSYAGRVDMGLHCDPMAVREPERLRAALRDAFAELGIAEVGTD
ncbi:MAG TPA: wax ester/triacylglycerol synthase domain-containing protein [Acidimicrobiales bacterium]|nr:wax ester/triacylglycerol synthase domain-containing protein [Acidimicrobiales bacterium]